MSTPLPVHDFSDPRVILVRGDDDRCGRYWAEDAAGFEQAYDGPTYLVVGRLAPDEKLQKLAGRFRYSMSELKAFRSAAPGARDAGTRPTGSSCLT